MAELVMNAPEITADPGRWLELRQQGITATDAATILGVSSWDSPFALWHRKKGNLPERPDNDRMRLGRYLEDYVVERWEEVTGQITDPDRSGLWRDGWRLATVDRKVVAVTGQFPWGVLECKTVGSWDGWGHGLNCGSPDCHDDNTVPAHVRVQALWQADVLGVPVAHIAALHRQSGEFRWYTLDALGLDDEAADWRAACQDFYRSLQDGTPPPVDGAEATTDALKHLYGSEPGKTAFLDRKLVNEWTDARIESSRASNHHDLIKNQVREAMGDAKYARYVDEEGQEWQVATRTISKRAGYWVPPGETDTLRYGRKQIDD